MKKASNAIMNIFVESRTRRLRKNLCLILALIIIMTQLAACKKDPTTEFTSSTAGAGPALNTDLEGAALTGTAEAAESNNISVQQFSSESQQNTAAALQPDMLNVGYGSFSQRFSPFFARTEHDKDVSRMTQLQLMISDRAGNIIMNGIKGETVEYNGVDYYYKNIADISIVRKYDGTIDYNIILRDDIVFSDGEKMTIDDVIFSLYVLCDPAYDGNVALADIPIVGMQEYRTGVTSEIYEKYHAIGQAIFEAGSDNTDYSGWEKELQDAFWSTGLNSGGVLFVQEIIDYCVANYQSHLSAVGNSETALGMYVWGFGKPNKDGVFVTSVTNTEFDIPNGVEPTTADYWNELLAAYGMDFSTQGIGRENAGTTPVEDYIIESFILSEGPKDPESGSSIRSINGIRRTGDYTLTVTTERFEAAAIYEFCFEVAPMHYYGDKSLYDYDNNMFGFPKGDLSGIMMKTTEPMGAGPYKLLSYEDGIVSFEANENYFKGEPKIEYIRFIETADEDILPGIVSGSLDIAEQEFTAKAIGALKEYNGNDGNDVDNRNNSSNSSNSSNGSNGSNGNDVSNELYSDVVSTKTYDYPGYGYIGISAANVKVGNDRGSEASKHLRTALATVFAVYREEVIDTYYGDSAGVLQYPISNTSWAAPRKNDDDYRLAYSTGIDGTEIYNDNMNEKQKHAAALDAAIAFFKAAGYVWDDDSGTFTAAPAGAKLSYTVIIPAGGIGDHPSYGIITAAKEALATIGITIEINDPTDTNALWRAIEFGQAELWCAAWQASPDPDMYQAYHSANISDNNGTDNGSGTNNYTLADNELDELLLHARSSTDKVFREIAYKKCLEIIMDWAVEIPVYQRKNAVIISSERVNITSVMPDITIYRRWMADIEQLKLVK